jgi:hypothetical protein
VALLLRDPRVNPADFHNEAICLASQYGRLEIVEMLLRDPRVDPAFANNAAIKAAIQSQSYLPKETTLELIRQTYNYHTIESVVSDLPFKKTDSIIKLKLVQLLLRNERVDPSARHNELLHLADAEGCKPVFELMLRDLRVKMSLFFGLDVFSEDVYSRTYKGNKGKLLFGHLKQICRTSVLCFNRAWMRGLKVPNDVVRLVVSEWCRIEIKVQIATGSSSSSSEEVCIRIV